MCDCPEACLNDGVGGCDTDYQCTVLVFVTYGIGFATSTTVDYTTTITDYYSTVTSYDIVTEEDTYTVTATDVDTEVSGL